MRLDFLESTSKQVEVNGVPARIWEGKTITGIRCVAFITRIMVAGPSYRLCNNCSAFDCLLCGHVSYNPHDIEHRYCSFCHIFHDQVQVEAEIQKAERA